MNTIELINLLHAKNIHLQVQAGKLQIQAPKGAMSNELFSELKRKKAEVTEYILSTKVSVVIESVGREGKLLPSYGQQRLWLLDQIDGGSAHYNMPGALKLTGKLDYDALELAFSTILERHESLRTCLAADEAGEPYQVIRPASTFSIAIQDLSTLAGRERESATAERIKGEAARAFDLSNDLMLRAQLLKVAEDEHVLLVTMHHIASDGWSMSILINEFSTLYRAYSQGHANPLPPLAIQYADYAHWQRSWLQGEVLDEQLGYWEQQLADLPVAHSLPLDRPRPRVQGFTGRTHYSHISKITSQALNTLCQAQEATVFMGLQAAFSVLLSRYSNETDIVVGSPIANREQAEVAGLIGFFVNTLVLRSDLSGNPSFVELLNQTKNMLLDAYAHQQVPFEQIVERLQPERSVNHSPLFQVMLILQNNEAGTLELPGLTLSQAGHTDSIAQYDLTLNVRENPEGLFLYWSYNTDLFDASTIARMAEHFNVLLAAMVTTPQESVFTAEMLSEAERHQLLVDWNDTAADYPAESCIHELFEAQVENNPEATALVFDGQQLTYGELNHKANQLANYLVTEKQVQPDTLVGICIERSLEMVVAILGVLKAGGAYVPLDPDYPAARLVYMLDDASLNTVITQTHLLDSTPITSAHAVCLDDEHIQAQLDQQASTNLSPQQQGLSASHLAYVIYTSGSTGKPKGVMIQHSNTTAFLSWASSVFTQEQMRCVLASTSVCFDLSVFELFAPLSTGGSVLVVKNILELQHRQYSQKISLINTVPSAAKALLSGGFVPESVNAVNLAGEPLKQNIVDSLYEAGVEFVYDLYGPSEDTTYTTFFLRSADGISCIGRPIHNTQVYLLNEQLHPVPGGTAGELFIGGAGLARGYLNRPDLTAEKFIANPFYDKADPNSSERLYKTGDLVRWLPDGNLAFLGRIDHQVKIRGFRIELGEVESSLSAHDSVKDAVVIAKGAEEGDNRLVAYVVTDTVAHHDDETAATNHLDYIEHLRQHLSQSLPDYMVPSAFVLLEHLPLTPNGKVDRKALPEPDLSQQQGEYVAPRTETEKVLCDIWQEVLGVERVGVTDNFFQLGGHSLLGTRVVSRIHQKLDVDLSLKTLFNTQSLELLAQALLMLDSGLDRPALVSIDREGTLLPSYGQQRLWLLDQIDGGSAHYNMPGAIKLSGKLDYSAVNQAFSTIVERHESLRTCFAADEAGEPNQVIRPASAFSIAVQDLSMSEDGERDLAIAEQLKEESGQTFDLSNDSMLRARLLKVAEDEHILLVTMHHIASDGWSMSILINEFSTLYRAYSQGLPNLLPPLAIQYADYAHWQRNWLQGDVLDEQLGYWEQQLADLPVAHSLPLDRSRPRLQSFAGSSYYSHIDKTTSQTLSILCQAQGATVFMGLHAAFSALLSRYSNETDIVVGSPIANREQAEIADLIGFFVNTLVLRCDLSATPSFTELLNQSKAMLLDAYAHQQVPFEQIVERLQPARSTNHSPLFQVMLVLQNNEAGILELPGLTLNQVAQNGVKVAKYDLTLNVSEGADGLFLNWEYNTDLFDASTIARMAEHFNVLLVSMVTNPQESVFAAEMLSEAERQQLLVDWNATAADYPAETCIHELFEAQAESNPDAIALVFDGQPLTYGELNKKANQLAHYLASEKQVQPDTLVGICIERSPEMVVAILGVLKAGGAYVPLDPEYPAARLTYMLDDAALATVITHSRLLDSTPITSVQAVCLDDGHVQAQLDLQSSTNLNSQQLGLTASHLAYVIYTSGSTGKPKGVQAPHASIHNRISWMEQQFPALADDVFCQKTAAGFVDHVAEIFQALAYGRPLIIIRTQDTLAPESFAKIVAQYQITRLTLVPSLLKHLIEHDVLANMTSLRLVISSGEALQREETCDFYRMLPGTKLLNLYGSSEVGADVTGYLIDEVEGLSRIPIGRPIYNTQLQVLNAQLELVPQGATGELHISGAGLARGYLNRPDLTAEKFIANPFYDNTDPDSCERLYKTGDLVRWLPDGNLEFLGRIDHQVKIRGFRIELGEIENSLSTYELVKDAVVLVKGSADGDARLVAYVVTGAVDYNDDDVTFTEQLRLHLSQRLPDYMVPNAFVLLEQFPLAPNGKVDRKALPEPDLSQQQAEYIAPRTETEKVLCDIWQELLGLDRVGVTDNFFQLGGHSLLGTRVVSRIHQALDVALPLKTLFNTQSLDQLAQALLTLDSGPERPALVSVAREGTLLPSYGQQRLWLLDQIDGGSAHYNMPGALRLSGTLDCDALNQAFSTILDRHESLRTCFAADEAGEPYQVIRPASAFSMTVRDLSMLEGREREVAITEKVREEAVRVFDLSNDSMLRGQLLKVAEDEHILLVTMHHIASDGWSMSILINEFSTLYRAYSQGKTNPLPPLAIQYADYAHWQRSWLQGEVLDEQLGYWEKLLADLPVAHNLPLDRPRPQLQSFVGSTHYSHIDKTTSQALSTLCQAQGATVFMGLHAAFSALLSRYSNETDIVMGSPIANREQAEIAGLIGFFVNTLVLRSDLSENPNFSELLEQSKNMLLDVYAHQQVPFEQIVERLQPERTANHSPLFQVMLILQNNETGTLELPGLTLSPAGQMESIAKYDLTLNVSEGSRGLFLNWEYNTDLFDAGTIARMAEHFNVLLSSMVTTPQESVFTAEMLSEAERHQLLVDWNDTRVDYPAEACIHELFEAQAESNPEATALVFDGQQLTYGELNRKANQLAHYLVTEKQVQPDTLVGICIERSLEMVVAILGILKAGGAYVPLDPDYPAARLVYMLDDAQLVTVITHSNMLDSTLNIPAQAVCFDDEQIQAQLDLQPLTNLSPQQLGLTASHLAYVIYTSGSTGKPKGVQAPHVSIHNRVSWMEQQFPALADDVFCQKTAVGFVDHVAEIFQALAYGRPLIIVRTQDTLAPESFANIVAQHQITRLTLVPSLLKHLIEHNVLADMSSLRLVISSGEELQLEEVRRFYRMLPGSELLNLYGSSEVGADVTGYLIDDVDDIERVHRIPIGRPINNTQLQVLNAQLELVPQGTAGELHIGGAGLARGYLNRPDLTAEKFITNPLFDKTDPDSCERLYKTGDLVRWLPDGNLEFLGRIDHQVKIRGFRIEMGEIENSLNTHTSINDAVVLIKESGDGDKRLVAYVVTDTDTVAEHGAETAASEHQDYIEHLRQHLSERLPDYMVPSAFVLLEQLPLNLNGKVDRKSLPEPDLSQQQAQYVAPRTETEKILCAIWQEVLGVERVGITDNFFQLGGHSLLLTKVLGKLNTQLKLELSVRDVFEHVTICLLAEKVEQQSTLLEINMLFEQATTESAEQTEEFIF